MNNIIDQLAQYARREDVSRKILAKEIGIPYSSLNKWLSTTETRRLPSKQNLSKIEAFLQRAPQMPMVLNETHNTPVSDKYLKLQKGVYGMSSKRKATTIREPIHSDISLSKLEVSIIDTLDFQRLRHIKQLGTTSLVYPGANHTRFEHSLGTVAAAQQIIDCVNDNPNTPEEKKIKDPEIVSLIRTCALLHDITHVPYGHTIEDEGFLYTRHDDADKPVAETRWDRFLGPSSEIGKTISELKNEDFRQKVLLYLTTKGKAVKELEHPYISDIVGNTVCADLLDYLARDTYFTGLKETFDPRCLKYLMIASSEEYGDRLVLSVIKEDRLRRDVISEVLHLLRLRYSLAEKVYFHHAKVYTSAMLIEAVQAAKIARPQDFTIEKLCDMWFGDEELMAKVQDCDDPIAKKLALRLSNRSLYRPVYTLTYSQESAEDTSWESKLAIIDRFRENPDSRFELERALEKWNRLPLGSVIIYCPTAPMNLKELEVLCLWRNGEIRKLKEIPGGKVKSEADEIAQSHKELWKMHVLLERNLTGELEKERNLASDCYHQFHLPNTINNLTSVGKSPIERYIEEWALDQQMEPPITVGEIRQLHAVRGRYDDITRTSPPTDEELITLLEDIRK